MNKMHTAGFPHAPIGKTNEWFTPQPIIDALGGWGSFNLDPCSSGFRSNKTAREYLDPDDDGLTTNWGDGRVWLNPPYNRYTVADWMKKMAEHNHGTALVSARTDTEWFHRWIFEKASALLFLKGRIHFLDREGVPGKHNSGGPSVLVAYGESDADILEGCGLKGEFLRMSE